MVMTRAGSVRSLPLASHDGPTFCGGLPRFFLSAMAHIRPRRSFTRHASRTRSTVQAASGSCATRTLASEGSWDASRAMWLAECAPRMACSMSMP